MANVPCAQHEIGQQSYLSTTQIVHGVELDNGRTDLKGSILRALQERDELEDETGIGDSNLHGG